MGNIADIYGEPFDTDRDDANTGSSFDPIPPGWYPVQIENAEIRENLKKTGYYLKLELTVIGPEIKTGSDFSGRKLFPMITMINPNKDAESIGKRDLAALGQAAGIPSLSDTDELLGKAIEVHVIIEKAEKVKPGYEPDNQVKAYRAPGSGGNCAAPAPAPAPQQQQAPAPAPVQQQAQPQQAPAASKPAAGKLPWQR